MLSNIGVYIVFLLAVSLWPQTQPTPASGSHPPVEYSDVVQPTSGQHPVLGFIVTNVGKKPITAYTTVIHALDLQGKPVLKLTNTQMSEEATPDGKGVFRPGEKRHLEMNVPVSAKDKSLKTADYRFELDFVIFADGSTWGPDKENSSTQIQAMRQGMAMERARKKD